MAHSTHHEPARDIPVVHEVEVLVVGGGPAGVGAAVRAAREGADVLLVETQGMLGGTWTASMQVHATCFFDGEKVVAGGLVREIIEQLAAVGAARDPSEWIRQYPGAAAVHFEPEWMKCFLDDIVVASGARLLLHTMCVGAIVEGDRVRGIITESKSGRRAFRAQVTIDCTGDADVAHFAGAPTDKGRAADGKCQPVNTTFLTSNVDWDRAVAFVEADRERLRRLCQEARRRGELEGEFLVHRLGSPTMYPDVVYHNMGHVFDIDVTRAEDLTRAELEGRRQVRQIYQFYRRHVPGFEQARLAAIAPMVGLRESRRIRGEYRLTGNDVVEAHTFDDGIARHNYRLDVHSADGLEPEPGLDGRAGPAKGKFYEVPYRCLVPQQTEALLVAGRCVSADRAALGSARTTVCCMQMGEAAGLAAVRAVQGRTCVRDVDGAALKRSLLA